MKLVTKSFTFEGKRYYVRAKTEDEAIRRMDQKKQALERGFVELKANITVKEWGEIWLEEYKQPTVEHRTYMTLKGIMNNVIYPEIGRMRIKSVRQVHIQRMINTLGGRSKSYVQKTLTILTGMFDCAILNRYIEVSPVQRITPPKTTEGTHRALTEDERKYFLMACEVCGNAGRWGKLMYYCGLRPSECEVITGKDIDREKQLLHVRGTKTKSADRYVPYPAQISFPELKDNEYLFKTKQGTKISKTVRKRYWEVLVRRMNILMGCEVNKKGKVLPPYKVAEDFVPYCLRHNYATMCQEAGVEIGVAAKLLGHANISTTSKIYTHANTPSLYKAAKLLESYCDTTCCTNTSTH